MKISYIQNHNINKKYISFGNGKIEVYSDFDKTYFPLSHEEMKVATPEKYPYFNEYCKRFSELLNTNKNFLNFHITTGRTLGETNTIYELIKRQGFTLPLPKTLIVKNGSDEHFKIGNDFDFYQRGIFPFDEINTNKEKEQIIRNITNWDGPKIKSKVIELLKKMGMKIVFADSEHSEFDYGVRSLFGENRLPYENGKVFNETDKAQWISGIRQDGNLKLFLTLPPDMFDLEERKLAYNSFTKELEKFTDNIKIDVQLIHNSKECQGRPCIVIEPSVEIDKHKSSLKNHQSGLTKVFDTREALKKAVLNNDLLIVAGDSSNDFNMLNMYFYSSNLPKYTKGMNDNFIKRLNYDAFNFPALPNEFIDLENITHKKIIDEIKKLPIVGIVMADDNGQCKLDDIVSAFGKKSPFKKVIVVPNGRLDDGIKYAIKLYALQNREFANKLSTKLKKEISYIDISKDIEAGKPLALLDKPDILFDEIEEMNLNRTKKNNNIKKDSKLNVQQFKKMSVLKILFGLGLITAAVVSVNKLFEKQYLNKKIQ